MRVSEPARIGVIGAGYVGLTTGACLAQMGHRVVCADIDEARIAQLGKGRVPFHEEGLAEVIRRGLDSRRLSFKTRSASAVVGAGFVFLCVPTPSRADGSVDLDYVAAAAEQIGPHLEPGTVVVTKSTVPVGGASVVSEALDRPDVTVVANPEFLREGTAVADFLNPDRVVIGARDLDQGWRVAALYESLDAPILVTDPATAELTKYAANAFLALKLSFANSVATLCEILGADTDTVIEGISLDPRIGAEYLRPGPGWGGSCLPKDTRALMSLAVSAGYDFSLLESALAQNDDQFDRVVAKVASKVALDGARIALLGLAFKAGTDDIRASPALEIARRLVASGARVRAYDPVVTNCEEPGVIVVGDPYTAGRDAQALVVATEWPELASLDPARMAEVMAERHVIDTRNLFDHQAWSSRGFTYQGTGRA